MRHLLFSAMRCVLDVTTRLLSRRTPHAGLRILANGPSSFAEHVDKPHAERNKPHAGRSSMQLNI